VPIDDPLWELFRAVSDRGAPAWPALAAALDPELARMARRQPIGRLRDREDTPREIVTRALARIHAREFAAIKRLVAMDPPPEVRAWLRLIVKRSAIDYMRETPEFERGNAHREPRWISLATLHSHAASPGPDSIVQKRHEVTSFLQDAVARCDAEVAALGKDDAIARLALEWKIERTHVRRLIARGRTYLDVLHSVLAGNSYPVTAEQLGLSRREVELSVRYLEELLAARGFGG